MPPKLYRKTQDMAINFLMMRNIWNHSFTSMFFQIYKLSLLPKFSLHQKLTYHNQKLWNWKNVCSFGIFWKSDLRKNLFFGQYLFYAPMFIKDTLTCLSLCVLRPWITILPFRGENNSLQVKLHVLKNNNFVNCSQKKLF